MDTAHRTFGRAGTRPPRRTRHAAWGAALALLMGASATAQAQYTGPVAISQHTEGAAAPAPDARPNQLAGNITGGVTANTGNTRAYSATLGGRLFVIRDPHMFTLEALALVVATKVEPQTSYEKTAANIIGKARYDRFLSKNDAVFAALVPRRDIFAGLNLRLQMQAGYMRNLFFPKPEHRFWTELGYDLTYDDFAKITTVTPVEGSPFEGEVDGPPLMPGVGAAYTRSLTRDPGHDFVHSARLWFGYTNAINPGAVLNLGAEVLFDVQDGKNVRVNSMADFTTSVSERLKLGVVSRMFFDNVPVTKDLEKTDFIFTFQAVYTFDTLAGQLAAPACNCGPEVEAAKKAWEDEQAAKAVPAPIAPQGSSPSLPAETPTGEGAPTPGVQVPPPAGSSVPAPGTPVPAPAGTSVPPPASVDSPAPATPPSAPPSPPSGNP
jgi:hypothetical protein